jgi:hypothetical protein
LELGVTYSTEFAVEDVAGAPTNPSSSSCSLTLPDGTTVAPALTNPSTGVLRLDYVTVQEGRHSGKVTATVSSTVKVQPFEFDVVVSRAIVSLAYTRDNLNFDATTNDEEVRRFIEAATDFVEGRTGPVARQTVGPEIVHPAGGELWLRAPAISVSAITAAYGRSETYTVGDYTLDGRSGRLTANYGVPGFAWPVLVTYTAGLVVVPSKIREAALGYIRWKWQSQREPGREPGSEFEVGTRATVPFRILLSLEASMLGVVA